MRTSFNKAAKDAAKAVLPFAFIIGFLGLFSQNPALTIVGASLLPVLVLALWRRGEPQVLLFAASYQWLQIFMPVINANLKGIVIGLDIGVSGMGMAAWLGLISVLLVAFGMRLGVGRGSMLDRGINFEGWIEQVSVKRLFVAYLIAKVINFFFIGALMGRFPSGAQVFVVFKSFAAIFLFLIVWGAVRDKRFRPIALIVVTFEFLQGFSGYFSGFKEVLFICIVVYYSGSTYRVRLFKPLPIALIIITIMSGLVWQSIKPDYREFLNRGSGQQTVMRSSEERVNFLLDRVGKLTINDLADGGQTLISRVGYLEYFARSISVVPKRIPHQDGRLWLEVVEHIFKPRIFFPDKKSIDDSDRTNEFTGVRVADAEDGASISLGYIAESYIDFGSVYMFIPVCLLGLFWGYCYRLFCQKSPVPLLGLAVATAFIMNSAALVEMSNLKIVGGGVASILILIPVLRYGGMPLWRFLCIRRFVVRKPKDVALEPLRTV